MTLEESFGMKLHYVRGMVDGMAKRPEYAANRKLAALVETAKHELTTLTLMWGEIKSKRESEADQCQSK